MYQVGCSNGRFVSFLSTVFALTSILVFVCVTDVRAQSSPCPTVTGAPNTLGTAQIVFSPSSLTSGVNAKVSVDRSIYGLTGKNRLRFEFQNMDGETQESVLDLEANKVETLNAWSPYVDPTNGPTAGDMVLLAGFQTPFNELYVVVARYDSAAPFMLTLHYADPGSVNPPVVSCAQSPLQITQMYALFSSVMSGSTTSNSYNLFNINQQFRLDLQNFVGSMAQSLATLNAQTASLGAANSQLQSQVTALSTQNAAYVTQIASLQNDVSNLSSQVAQLTSANGALQQSNSSLTSQVSALTSQNSGLQGQLSVLQQQTQQMQTTIDGLNAFIANLSSQNASCSQALGVSQAQLAALTSDLASAQANVAALNGSVASLSTQLANAEAQLASAQAENSTLNSQLSAAQASNQALGGQLASEMAAKQQCLSQSAVLSGQLSACQTNLSNVNLQNANLVTDLSQSQSALGAALAEKSQIIAQLGAVSADKQLLELKLAVSQDRINRAIKSFNKLRYLIAKGKTREAKPIIRKGVADLRSAIQ